VFCHGKGKSPTSGWINSLYGDGHAASRHPRRTNFSPDGTTYDYTVNPSQDEIQPGWGGSGAPIFW
jgi:prepilin-type processing-associated H-X9-DG protein